MAQVANITEVSSGSPRNASLDVEYGRVPPGIGDRVANLASWGRHAESDALLVSLARRDSGKSLLSSIQTLMGYGGVTDRTVQILSKIASLPEARWAHHAAYGHALAARNRIDEAEQAFARAVEIAPRDTEAWQQLGVFQRQAGLRPESQASFLRALELDPSNVTALRLAGYEHRYRPRDELSHHLDRALSRAHQIGEVSLVELQYAEAKRLEDIGDVGTAFERYAQAGALQRELCPWSDDSLRRILVLLKQHFTAAKQRELRKGGVETAMPVFVFGMPRSGTTLVEQIIAQHPQAAGAGELKVGSHLLDGLKIGSTVIKTSSLSQSTREGQPPSLAERGRAYLNVLSRAAGSHRKRLVDKMPGNYAWLGFLDAMVPGSHFIHVRRHPIATCLSAYKLYFGNEVPYSYHLRDLARAYRQYDEYIEYWKGVLPPEKILEVNYEDVVSDLETEVRRIIEFVGLPWSESCLSPHQGRQLVRTASAIEVRRGVYRSSVAHWSERVKYLQPLVEELGDIVRKFDNGS